MTLYSGVTDDQLGRYYRRINAIAARLGKSLSFDDVMETLQRIHDGQVFRFTVDYDRLIEVMIAAGHYGWVNDNIAKCFQIRGSGIVHFEGRYFHPNRGISSEDAVTGIGELDTENPWMPAETEHMLAFGAKYPDEQRKHPIIGLGSVAVVVNNRRVLYLDGGASERFLSLVWWGRKWNAVYRFLAVRKVSVPQS